jgi:hypothetical protein
VARNQSQSHVSLFVSPELREAIERSAAANDRSLSAEVRVALRAYTSRTSGATPSLSTGVIHPPEGRE